MNRWETALTARTSVFHGGSSLGTIHYLRRERFILPNGDLEEIPVVSGNAIRGAMRDVAALEFCEVLGEENLPLPLVQLLFSGGGITKSFSGEPLSGSRLASVRQACPPLSLLGGAMAGTVSAGTFTVGKMIPICAELAHLIPRKFHNENLPSYWDLTQIEEFSRFSDDGSTDLMMRYGMETFLPGTRFYWWGHTSTKDEAALALAFHLIHLLTTGQLQVGGGRGRGMGEVFAETDYEDCDWVTPLLNRVSVVDIIDRLKAVQ